MELLLKIIGGLLVLLAAIHIAFPKYFDWKVQLSSLSLINREMMYVHTFFIAFVVLLMGLLCLTSASELVNTALGKRISLGLCIFWTVRLFVQFFVYSTKNWKGKLFETTIHISFIMLWSFLGVVFYLAYAL